MDHRHQSHYRRDEPEEYPPTPPRNVPPPYDPYHNQPPPPPHVRPAFDPYYNHPPPPPQVIHVSHHGGGDPHPNYPPPNTGYYPPPAPSHEVHHGSGASTYPPPPRADPYPYGSNVQHVSHESNRPQNHHVAEYLNRKPSVRIYTKAETNYSLTIRDGKVILAPSNPSDPFQHWVKDEKFSTKVKDEQSFPSFALVNKATGQAMKHSIGATHPVQLIPYDPDKLDESILWTFSTDLGDSYRTIRMVNNIRLNVDAFNGDKNHGGVRDGTTIVLWEWLKGENQRWKIVPY